MKIGILGLQGDVREHVNVLQSLGVAPVTVKRIAELDEIDALIAPGGESTTIGKLLERFGLLPEIRERVEAGLPLFGTCAGAILMASEVVDGHEVPHRLAVMDIAVRRNAYGRQAESFEAGLRVLGMPEPVRAAFIRAPVVERTGPDVEILATWEDRPVLVRQGRLLASTFHPEVTGETAVHASFLEMVS